MARFGPTAALLLALGCGSDPTTPSSPPPIDSPTAVVGAIADAYRMLDSSRFERVIAQEPGAEFRFQLAIPLPGGRTSWDAASELYIHRRMLVPPSAPGSKATSAAFADPPVPPELRVARIEIALTPEVPFTEVETPQGLDPRRWRAFMGTYGQDLLADLQGPTDYRVIGRSQLIVIEDLSKAAGDAGSFLLYSWSDLGLPEGVEDVTGPEAVAMTTWSALQLLYAGGGPESPAEFVQELADAYRQFDRHAFEALFHQPDAEAPYRFLYVDDIGRPANWDAGEELRIHRRMFEPQNPLAGERPVPEDLWPQAIWIALTPAGEFTERPEYYRSPSNPDGIDPERWRAVEAQYNVDLLFDLQGPNDYRVVGKENFVVIDLRQRLERVPGKYSLYRWEDLGSDATSAGDRTQVEPRRWALIKRLYQ